MAKTKTRTITRYVRRPRSRSRGFTVPVAVIAGLAVPAFHLWNYSLKEGNIPQTANTACAIFTGYNPQAGHWDWKYTYNGLMPVVAGFAVHKLASKLGVNRALASAGVPFIRI